MPRSMGETSIARAGQRRVAGRGMEKDIETDAERSAGEKQ